VPLIAALIEFVLTLNRKRLLWYYYLPLRPFFAYVLLCDMSGGGGAKEEKASISILVCIVM
jgi:hypothetical protein